jgi:2-keto-3-deoxy-L-rhamnonate aldolase RhmA
MRNSDISSSNSTPGIGYILKSAGCDFVLFDLEHSGFGFETVKSAIRYFEAADLPAIVRAVASRTRPCGPTNGGCRTATTLPDVARR